MINKTQLVLNHLKASKTITSWEAIQKFGATRLSAIIFNLRANHNIETNMIDVPTRFGTTRVAQYIYKGAIK